MAESFKRNAVEEKVKKIVIDSEYTKGLENKIIENSDFEAIIDLLECERNEKHADWRSDIFIPQFFSEIITQASTDASQYFQNRDYVETYVSDGTKTEQANASERALNRTLNQKHLYNYQKFMRLRMINYLKGETYARLWWEKKLRPITRYEVQPAESDEVDIFGDPLVNPEQKPMLVDIEVPVEDREVVYDRANYDVLDPRTVLTDNNYVYSLQQKEWVIIFREVTLDKLEEEAEDNEYFNLDKLTEIKAPSKETDTSKTTVDRRDKKERPEETPSLYFDKIERFGKFWCIVKERYPDGYPLEVEPGYDDMGEKKKGAEYIECLITFAKNAATSVMIGFQPQRCRDSKGNAYRPIVRGLQYIHPTEDNGIGDGKPARELQVAMNDTFNLNNDRTMLATMPTFKMKKFGNQDNTTIRFAPEHIIELESADDLQEIQIRDNMQGANIQIAFLKSMMEQAMAQSPGTMGVLPEDSSTTATAIAGAEARTNVRSNYKSLTFENTFLAEFYWMHLQLIWQYAEEETAEKLLGDKMEFFDPDGDYFYKPVSQSIETEYSRNAKIKNLLTALSYVAQIPNSQTATMVNYIMVKFFELMGDEFDQLRGILLNPNEPVAGVEQTAGASATGASNQNAVAMSGMEAQTREAAVA